MERAGDDGGRGCRLKDWGFVCPEKSETCLDEGAERSGKPKIGSLVLAIRSFGGWDGGGEFGYQDWSSISKRRSGGMGRGRAIAVDWKD